jgi:hypothetical protein
VTGLWSIEVILRLEVVNALDILMLRISLSDAWKGGIDDISETEVRSLAQ